MLAEIGRLSWTQRLSAGLGLLVATAVVVFEGVSAETAATGAGLVVTGLLSLVALAMPSVRALVVAEVAAASIAFTLLCRVLPHGLDNTFGVVETGALVWLTTRSVIELRPSRSALVVPLLCLAVVSLPTRCFTLERPQLDYALVILAMGMMFVVLLGMYLRLHDQRRADAGELAKQAQRLAYARDLHDFVAHHVTGIVVQAQGARAIAAKRPDLVLPVLVRIEKAGVETLDSMRRMVGLLRDDDHLALAPVAGVPEVRALVADFGAALVEDGDLTDLAVEVTSTVHRVVMEALTNIRKHATDVHAVEVLLCQANGWVVVKVTDDGTPGRGSSGGFGLRGLDERVTALGGRIHTGPVATGGWAVEATLPARRTT